MRTVLAALFLAGGPAWAGLDDDGGGSGGGGLGIPQLCEAGDVPTAYGYAKHELRADVRFYGGGGLMAKASFGIFSRFSLGAGLNLPGLIGSGPVTLTREDAQLSLRVLALEEGEAFPAASLGWDGPAYAGGELRGLYLALSKELSTPAGFVQLHGGMNSPTGFLDGPFVASRDLRGFAAFSTTYRQLTVFSELDEMGHPAGPRWNAGGRYSFEPISLGLEFQDLGAIRAGSSVSRILKVSYTGLF